MQQFSVPFAVDLTNEAAWKRTDNTFLCIRFNFVAYKRSTEEVKPGRDIQSVYRAPAELEASSTQTFEFQETVTNSIEQAKVIAIDHETATTVADEIGANLGASVATLKAGLSAKISQTLSTRIKSSVSFSAKTSAACTTQIKRSTVINYKLPPGGRASEQTYHGHLTYQRYALDVVLGHIDYLSVTYTRGFLDLRRKRRKSPALEGNHHRNIIKCASPMFTMLYWQPIETNLYLVPDDKKGEAVDPLEIEVVSTPVDRVKSPPVTAVRPTLYQLSNVAFPLRWKDRDGSWTEQELSELVDEEKVVQDFIFQRRRRPSTSKSGAGSNPENRGRS